MAEPGDPHSSDKPARTAPDVDAHAHDDLIGFTSPASLSGRGRPALVSERESEVEAAPAPEAPQPEFDFDPLARTAQPVSRPTSEPSAIPSWAVETPSPPAPPTAPPLVRPTREFGRAGEANPPVEGATGLYTVYALILFAVPTLGVSALIALLAIWGRPLPDQPIARSHVLFQKRTLWIAAIAAVLGAILIAVNLGVFVLFIMAVWVILRGAWGVMTLAAGKTIADPHHWLISRTL